jgi:glutamate synthase (NADPH/NADH) large chain
MGRNFLIKQQDLYDPGFEHSACGVGFVVNIKGQKSHQIVADGITILKNLVHRGAIGGDQKTGDGAGIMLQVPHLFFAGQAEAAGIKLPAEGQYGIGMLFLPQEEEKRQKIKQAIDNIILKQGGTVLGYRTVPTDPSCLGEMALESMPFMAQVFVTFGSLNADELERRLYLARRLIEKKAFAIHLNPEQFYLASFSGKTICYKGMFVGQQVEDFFVDLKHADFISALAVIHQRYSTNTFPSWPLAQPFRYLAHNGEINTLRGNINKMTAREKTLKADYFGRDIKKLLPIINPNLSDSGILDNVFELLMQSGRSLEHSMMMMIPEAFGPKYHISQDKRAFYEYHAAVMEPWDGPAAVSFTDGVKVGAILDRNGLRPARYIVTKSGKLVLASEVGVLDIQAEDVLQKGRLGPGKMILVDTARERIIYDNEIKATISRQKPYRRWLENYRIELKGLFQAPGPIDIEDKSLKTRQKAFGYTLEEINMILAPMAVNAQEPISSMGNDVELAVLAERPVLLFNYFKQLFAQVTNPPIDPYRENLVMSLMSFLGREHNLMEETPLHCRQLKLPHPILTNDDMKKLHACDLEGLKASALPIFFSPSAGKTGLQKSLAELCSLAEEKVDQGYSLLILTDRGVSESKVPIPSLLALSAVHQHLIKTGKRHLAGIIVETAEAREVMHFATLIGFGASAINPYLAFETIADLNKNGDLGADLKTETAFENYITALKKGLLKIMSKMGVSTIRSYKGAQLFEAVGLNSALIKAYFPGTPSRIEGVGLDTLSGEALARHSLAFNQERLGELELDSGGDIHYRANSLKHIITPEAIALLQKAVRENDYELYKKYSALIDDGSRNLCTLRGLFRFINAKPIPLEQVEPVESIIKRFVTSAMSFGSISKEAHETMAIAMNRLGSRSNSGEGGEDEARYLPLANGDLAMSKIKQVASGRFGVTSNYLIHADELQIKMAQGAKPGEGGQLPGHKVDEMIARVRHSTPGVMLISPPPHHDIYSIEDLAQLIYDLKNANPRARVSVKLVAEVGVGTVAAGVAKGKADMVLISGHDGGTGASPISSIKHTGIPWEIGLAETQQTLLMNKLRDRIRVQVDGKLKTGRDVVIASLLGAEEFGFGTMSLISLGCIMMRKCHLNTCPVGVATQDPKLRKRFQGRPEHLINFMSFVAREVREIMAGLGFKTIDQMVGRVEFLAMDAALAQWKAKGLDFSRIFFKPKSGKKAVLHCVNAQNHDTSLSLDKELISQAGQSLENKGPVKLFASIRNNNRTVGATLSAEVSKRFGSEGLPEDTIYCKFNGSAGQSFGAFLAPGLTFELEGDSNDYFGKGLSGGKLIVYPPRRSTFRPQNNIITGNVNLFGATSGWAYINGMAGERFAVRNSGATAVVEGVGDHACEYMTGGLVVVLGSTGINFAAGMSGGIAYVLDQDQLFDTRCNLEMVDIEPVTDAGEQEKLRALIQNHVHYTESEYAARILRDFSEVVMQFVKVMPIDYRRALERLKKQESKETEVVAVTEEVFS